MLALEWPLGFVAGTAIHRSLEFRLAVLPLTALSAALIYQGTNAALYYMIGMIAYFWAYSEGEVSLNLPNFLRQRFANEVSSSSAKNPGLCPNVDEVVGQVVYRTAMKLPFCAPSPCKGVASGMENVYIETGETLRQQKTTKNITNQHHLHCHLPRNRRASAFLMGMRSTDTTLL